jgi:purine-nucleoside phosphorylase
MMTLEEIKARQPKVGIVLGSGLGSVADALGIIGSVPYAEVPGLACSQVQGHRGLLGLAEVAGQPIVIAQGRIHLYEGHSAAAATEMMRIMHDMGVRTVVLTNAAGCINSTFEVGQLMVITDHINLTGTSPLLGGPHFVDMSAVYSEPLRRLLCRKAELLGITLYQGVYAGLLGPQYETPAEIRMLRILGADAVGMSTVLEAIRARALGMDVLGISTLTNWAAGLSPDELDHGEVMTMGRSVAEPLAELLAALLSVVGKDE